MLIWWWMNMRFPILFFDLLNKLANFPSPFHNIADFLKSIDWRNLHFFSFVISIHHIPGFFSSRIDETYWLCRDWLAKLLFYFLRDIMKLRFHLAAIYGIVGFSRDVFHKVCKWLLFNGEFVISFFGNRKKINEIVFLGFLLIRRRIRDHIFRVRIWTYQNNPITTNLKSGIYLQCKILSYASTAVLIRAHMNSFYFQFWIYIM